jgi:hypothetical protein
MESCGANTLFLKK